MSPKVFVGNKAFEVDDQGYLLNFEEWTEEFALQILKSIKRSLPGGKVCYSMFGENPLSTPWGGEITDEQRGVFLFLRYFFKMHERVPSTKEIQGIFGLEVINVMRVAPWAGMSNIIKAAGLPQRTFI